MAIYMATHIAHSKPPFDYIVPIFVGNSSEIGSYFRFTDQNEINISERNHIFGELTALYWIWKNTKDDIVGLCHYRRFVDVTELEIQNLLLQHTVIVPPSYRLKWQVDQQFTRVHREEIWKKMIQILYGKHSEYIPLAKKIFTQNVLYRHNIFIAKRAFLENYCAFVFDILFELEKYVELQHFDDYQQRYGGFVSERLFTLYILGNNISRVEKRIIDSSGKNISPIKWQQILNNLHFKVFGQ